MKTKILKFFNLAQGPEYKAIKYSKSGCGSGGGKPIYNREKLAKKSKPILGRSLTPDEVSRFLYATGKRVERGLKSGKLKRSPDGTIYEDPNKIEIEHALGNVFGAGGFNALAKEVWRLALAGKGLKNRSALCKKYHLPVDCIKEQWGREEEYLGKLSAREVEFLRDRESRPTMTRNERRSWREFWAKQRGRKPTIENKFEKPGRELSPRAYKEKFGYYPSDPRLLEETRPSAIREIIRAVSTSSPCPF